MRHRHVVTEAAGRRAGQLRSGHPSDTGANAATVHGESVGENARSQELAATGQVRARAAQEEVVWIREVSTSWAEGKLDENI